MCTTAGNLKPRIKYVIHAVGSNACETNKRQDCFDLVESMVLCGLEYAEHVLNSASIAVPAISSGIFGVPKIDVAQALYQAAMKFDETKPTFVKVVQLVNLDRDVTELINRDFAWWFGGARNMCVTTECRTTIPQRSAVRQGQGGTVDGDMGTNMKYAIGGDSLLVRRSKKKEYIPEKFTYFWRCQSPFSQHFKCEFVIDGRMYNCTEKWIMQQKCTVFGQLELAEKIMQMEDSKAMKRATSGKSIPNFSQSIWDRYSYGIVHEGNMHKFAQNLELYLALKGTKGTSLVEASPCDIVGGCGCREHEPAAKQRETWRGFNLLGEILTEVRDELMANRLQSGEGDILAVGLSIKPVTDFGELQRKCPEARIFIDYLKKGTHPTDQKWRRRLEHDAQNFFMRDRKLWHRQESTGRRHSFQEAMIQLVVLISERKDILNVFHGLIHLGFDKSYQAVSRVYF